MPDVFSVPVFFIVLRETLEASIIVSVLLAFLKQSLAQKTAEEAASDKGSATEGGGGGGGAEARKEAVTREFDVESPIPLTNEALHKRLVKQVWAGSIAGFILCLVLGGAFIGTFYGLKNDIWSKTEEIWEGVFSLIAMLLITLMGAAMLRVSKLRGKWAIKLKIIMEKRERDTGFFAHHSRKYAMFLLPFVTVLREGLEAVVFVGGVGLAQPARAFPLAVVIGLLVGILIGYFIYKGGDVMRLQWFLIASTCILYLVAAGLMSKACGYFEQYKWNKLVGGDAGEEGSGFGSYDFRIALWHVNYGNPEINNNSGWGVFNAILGWNNTGTYGSVISYVIYWWFVAIMFFTMRYCEDHPESRVARFFMRTRSTLSIRKQIKKHKASKAPHSDEKVAQTTVQPSSPA